jgi:hypothetical protein
MLMLHGTGSANILVRRKRRKSVKINIRTQGLYRLGLFKDNNSTSVGMVVRVPLVCPLIVSVFTIYIFLGDIDIGFSSMTLVGFAIWRS